MFTYSSKLQDIMNDTMIDTYWFHESTLCESDISQCSSESTNLSSVPDLATIPFWSNGDDSKRLDFIKRDCLARLEDVRNTNENAKSLSSFMSILALIGMLAKFAFETNLNLGQGINCGKDQKQYQAFCDRYILDDSDYEIKINQDGLSYLLYKFVRCGLLHGGTLENNRKSTRRQNVKIYLSHERPTNTDSYKTIMSDLNDKIKNASTQTNEVQVTLNAFVLCDAIEYAIIAMFDDKDDKVKESIVNTFKSEPPILCLKVEGQEEFAI